jgi:hypothetical protein
MLVDPVNNAMMCDNDNALQGTGQLTELVHIGVKQPEKTMNVREFFEQLATREAEMVRKGRERAHKRNATA